ncbi:uncharacterized protein LOC101213900 [Cucumis sativus]|uniref:Uncharacterized protein n=1 Tax=Cucumis sativus TaxID=3659 RepID=A0A0A0LDG5_CUCSA|nr:uncharacterized protein LOC101213900 [Cucumis sativus]KGN58954.1 hypothetical protein Csa_001707 [Cucumis sativus]
MNLKAVKWQIIHGALARRIVVRIFLLALAVSAVPLLHIFMGADFGVIPSVIFRDCAVKYGDVEAKVSRGSYMFQGHFLNSIWVPFVAMHCEEYKNLTTNVVAELMEKKLLNHTAKSLCVGEGSGSAVLALRDIGFSDVIGVGQHRFFSLRRKQFVYELDFKSGYFDFVFSRDLDRYSVPALLVLEIERVLRPGGIGAVIVSTSESMPNNLIRAATPVSSLLKTSTVMHVGHVNNLTLVVFKKKFEEYRHLEEPRLSSECRSLTRNKPLIPKLEPLVKERPVGFDKKLSYLPKFVDVSSGKRLIYVNIGTGKRLNHTNTDWFPPSYPVARRDFNVYFVDHDMSSLATHIHNPGVTFVYHPALAGTDQTTDSDDAADDEDEEPYIDDEFDFLSWFKETVQHSDFVVLKMDAGKEELKFLSDLFESGVICWVDEVFLSCRDGVDEEDGDLKKRECTDLYKDLRNSGVYVHQWFLDAVPSSMKI